MRLYFKNRRSPKPYKVVITSLENSRIGFIGEITNPTMKIGNGVVQFYLAPIATEGTWTVERDYHYKDGKLTVMAYKSLNYTNYNSHATYSNFIANIQAALEYIEFHQYQTVTDAVKAITELEGVEWTYDQENKRVIYYTDNKSGNLSLKDIATQINSFLISEDSVLKSNSELLVKEVIDDYFKPSPKGLIPINTFNTQFVNNAVIIKLGDKEYQDTYLNSKTTSSLNFHQDLIDRIPGTAWYTEGEGTVIEGGEAFSNKAYYSNGVIGNSLQSPSKLLTGGSTPFTISFDVLIKEDQVKANGWPHLALFSKTTNGPNGDQFLYVQPDQQYRLAFRRSVGVGGNVINEVVGKRRIEFNTKYTIKIVYDSNMFKVFVNNELDFQFGTSIGWYVDSDQPYRFLDDFVPAYPSEGNRGFTKGFVDNIQIQDGVAEDPTKVINAYADSLISKLTFQGQTGKANFVDEADSLINWTGYGDAKLVQTNELGLYSYLSLNGMGSYIRTTDSDAFKFNNKFTIHMKFKTSTKSKRQVLLDRFSGSAGNFVAGSYQVSINTDGKLYFTIVYSEDWRFLESNTSNLNDGNINTIDIVKDGSSLSFYINGLLDSMHDVSGEIFNGSVVNTTIGAQINNRNEEYDFNGNIYEFEVYKGVAVYPDVKAKELNKVELNFDTGSPVDIYGNSTWTNNGVTFGQVNSVKGSAAYFSNNATVQSSLTQIDFSNHTFELDINPSSVPNHSIPFAVNGHYLYVYIRPTSFAVEFYNSGGWINGYEHSCNFVPNQYNNLKLVFKNNLLYFFVNGNIIGISPNDLSAHDVNQSIIIGRPSSGSYPFTGHIDNFKSYKTSEFTIDRPVVHLPLESNVGNLGITNLEVTSRGNPTYHIIEDKKCIKFESGKYLTINNNIFNLGTSSDFYIEFDFYIDGYTAHWQRIFELSPGSDLVFRANTSPSGLYWGDSQLLDSVTFKKWYNIKIKRSDTTRIFIDNQEILSLSNYNIERSLTYFGTGSYNTDRDNLQGYITNFKMYVGTSVPVESYDHRKVLNLDFKPTYKSYLFKDNYNKMVIHPVGISYRGYENGRYCLNLNGTDQYLSLGKSNLLNFGTNDFIIQMEFSVKSFKNSWQTLLSTGDSYAALSISSSGVLRLKASVLTLDSPPNTIELNTTYKLIMYKENGKVSVKLNDTLLVDAMNAPVSFNMNSGDSTYIGCSNVPSNYLDALLFTVKIFRDTSDLSLLDETVLEPESPADVILDGIPPLEPGVLQFWQPRQEVDPHNVVLEFKQLRLN